MGVFGVPRSLVGYLLPVKDGCLYGLVELLLLSESLPGFSGRRLVGISWAFSTFVLNILSSTDGRAPLLRIDLVSALPAFSICLIVVLDNVLSTIVLEVLCPACAFFASSSSPGS